MRLIELRDQVLCSRSAAIAVVAMMAKNDLTRIERMAVSDAFGCRR
jgi:hypothetical protein